MSKFSIKTLEIAGFASAVQALRLPFKKECRSLCTTTMKFNDNKGMDEPYIETCSVVDFEPKDLHLMSTLIKRGDEHAKAIRGINVFAEINAPLSFWSEADTYRVGTERLSSESTMHTIGNGGVSIYDFCVPQILYDILGDEKKPNKEITPLRIDAPKELRSVIRNICGRDYEIWNNGEIYSLPFTSKEVLPNGASRERHFEKQLIKIGVTRNQQGYYQVRLGGRKGKTLVLHRLLAEAFVPNPNSYKVVNHKDGDKGNCSITNLEWCTSSDNNRHAYEIGLKEITIKQRYLNYKRAFKWTDEDVEDWSALRESGKTLRDIAELYGTTEHIICQYTKGERYKNMSEYSEWFALAKIYEDIIAQINEYSALYKESGDFEYVIRIKEILPTSFLQKRVQMFSYQSLRRIYVQRRNHRLPMWKEFCKWIETLPFAKELILIGLEDE